MAIGNRIMMKAILTPKVFIAALIIASVLLCSSLAYILIARPAATNPNLAPPSSAMTIIPAFTSTSRPMPPTLTPLPPTPRPTQTTAPGQMAVGVYVQPTTGGEGLRAHTDPALSAPFFAAFDSEIFLVQDGPQQADGYTWWYLTVSYDAARSGWAVQDYLAVVPSQ
jgi:hypothetical protein